MDELPGMPGENGWEAGKMTTREAIKLAGVYLIDMRAELERCGRIIHELANLSVTEPCPYCKHVEDGGNCELIKLDEYGDTIEGRCRFEFDGMVIYSDTELAAVLDALRGALEGGYEKEVCALRAGAWRWGCAENRQCDGRRQAAGYCDAVRGLP